MMNCIKHTGTFVLALTAAMAAGVAQAVPVTIAGTTVSFTFDSDLAGLFGAPSVLGDTIYFTPTSFKAQSFNGAGIVSTSQTFNIAVSANPGYFVSTVSLNEDGDYYNIGAGTGVGVGGKLIVRDLEAPLNPSASSSILPAAPLTAVTSLSGFETTNWTANAGVTIPAGWGGADGFANGVNVTIQNILLASSADLGTAAFIEKKFAGIAIVTSPVPEPHAYILFLAGLGLIGFMAIRRSAAQVA